VLRQFRRRAPVICLLAMFWLVTASVIQSFESLLHGNVLLVATMPMVMAIGGMVGSQASTLIIRALATGGKTPFRALVGKELAVSFTLAAVLGAVAFANAMFLQWSKGDGIDFAMTARVGLVIAAAMAADVVFAAGLGAAIPTLVRLLRIDPALISTPAVTALTDLTGSAIFLLLVTTLL
jgi:magnesium transporter